MTKVLHLIDTSGPGGAEMTLLNIVDHLDKRRYESLVLLLRDGWLNGQLRARGVETIILPQSRTFDVVWIRRLVGLLRSERIDVMHAQEFTMNTYGAITSAITGVPIVTVVQGKNYFWEKRRRRMAYRVVAKRSTMVAVSEDIRRFLGDRVGVAPDDVTVIHNGIDPQRYRPDARTAFGVRQELGLDGTRPVIGTVGNLYAVKGHASLVQAAARVVRVFPDAVFLFCGRGELLEALQTSAAALGLERNVRFLGFREDVSRLLQAMDVFVLPSLSEGLPLAALEAMAAGKPVVATNVGGTPEAVLDGDTGFLVPPQNPAALAEKLLILLRDPARARRMGESGRIRVESDFSVWAMVDDYEQLYAGALGRSVRKRERRERHPASALRISGGGGS